MVVCGDRPAAAVGGGAWSGMRARSRSFPGGGGGCPEAAPPMLLCARGGFIAVIVLAVAAQFMTNSQTRQVVIAREPLSPAGGAPRVGAATPGAELMDPPSHTVLSMTDNWSAVVAAVIGVAGYMADHFTARQAEARQAKLERVVAQTHDFLIPVITQMHSMLASLMTLLTDMEKEGVLWPEGYWVGCPAPPDASIPFDQHKTPKVYSLDAYRWALRHSDGKLFWRYARATELPTVLYECLEAELAKPAAQRNDRVWGAYERWARHQWVPAVREVAALITKKGDLMEPIDPKRLEEMWGGTDVEVPVASFTLHPRMMLYSMWLAYARGWDRQLAEWDAGCYTKARPSDPFPCGVLRFSVEGATQVSAHEKALVGSSQQHGSGPAPPPASPRGAA